jgi:N-acetylmuramoyl-L-alanine amidase
VRRRDLSRRDFLTVLAAVPLWLVLPSGLAVAATLRVTGLRRWSAPDYTRFVLELDAEGSFAEPRRFPDRIAIELHDAQHQLPDGDLPIEIGDGLVRRLVFTNAPTSLVLQVELVRDADVNVFTLPPNEGGNQHRIVIDVLKKLTDAEKRAQEREADAVRKSGDVVVCVDAGHGGNDPGCNGHGVVEKVVALDVALRLAKAIDARAGMRAVLTRKHDYFVPLGRRQQIAQRYASRVFVSIHLNSAPSATARGSEVFFLSPEGAADKAAKELADRENAADEVGGVAPGKQGDVIVDILWNMKQNEIMRQSERLGEVVVRKLAAVSAESRGLKQGPLAVLKSIHCASVLVELGFVTNRHDARMLKNPDTQQRFAELVAAGIDEHVRGAG